MNNDKVKLMQHIISDNHMCFSLNNIDINGITGTTLSDLVFISFFLTEFSESSCAICRNKYPFPK